MMVFVALASRPLAPYASHLPGHDMILFTLPLIAGAGLGAILLLMLLRRWKGAAILATAAVIAIAVFTIDSRPIANYRFNRSAELRSQIVEWVLAQPRGAKRLELPSRMAGLTPDLEIARYESDTSRWVFVPLYRQFLDEECGFAWSESGAPPPEGSRHKIIRTEWLGDGWFMYWTT
jgi:hypothetical protein